MPDRPGDLNEKDMNVLRAIKHLKELYPAREAFEVADVCVQLQRDGHADESSVASVKSRVENLFGKSYVLVSLSAGTIANVDLS